MKTKEIAQNLKKISEIQFFWKNNLLRKLVPPAKISTIKVLKISENISYSQEIGLHDLFGFFGSVKYDYA